MGHLAKRRAGGPRKCGFEQPLNRDMRGNCRYSCQMARSVVDGLTVDVAARRIRDVMVSRVAVRVVRSSIGGGRAPYLANDGRGRDRQHRGQHHRDQQALKQATMKTHQQRGQGWLAIHGTAWLNNTNGLQEESHLRANGVPSA